MCISDFLILALLGVSAWWGWRNGLVNQVASAVGIIAGLLACWLFGDTAATIFQDIFPSSSSWQGGTLTGPAVAHCLLFIIVYLSCRVAGMFVKSVIKLAHLGLVDRITGCVVSVAKVALIASVVLNVWFAASPQSSIFNPPGTMTTVTLNLLPSTLSGEEHRSETDLQQPKKQKDKTFQMRETPSKKKAQKH